MVVTQYNEFDGGSISMNELDAELKKKYPHLYHGYILFNARETNWEDEIREFITTLSE
jgi:hypothetical protein